MHERDVVGGRFEIETRVGAGGMGEVFRAKDRESGRAVAVKVLHDKGASAAERFVREARVLATLDHPSIVRYVAHGTHTDGELFLAMEWLEGEDLSQRLARGGLTVAESVDLTRRVAEALASAHTRGVVHRDIKPSNLFLVGGEIAKVRVLDFGIARHDAASRAKTRTGTMLGTLGYMAPEQARGDRQLDARADTFSLGCVLFECLTGRAAFSGENVMAVLAKVLLEPTPRVRDVRRDLGDAFDGLLDRMLAKDPAVRPSDEQLLRSLVDLSSQGGAAPSASASGGATITAGEQQLLCVVAAREAVRPVTTDGLEATMALEDAKAMEASAKPLQDVARAFDADLERLADGSLIAVMRREGAATDRVALAARCAIALRAHLKDVPVVVATGRGVMSERVPVGEVIDAAARMLDAADANGRARDSIALDEVTAGLLDARFEVAWEKQGPELRGERGTGESVRQLLGRATPCVGRERDLEQLESILVESIQEPRAAAVLVTAPAGYGKSRVLQELMRTMRGRGDALEIWVARGDAMTAGASFSLAGQIVRSAAGIVGSEPQGIRAEKLRTRVARSVGDDDADRVASLLGEMAGIEFPDASNAPLAAARQDPGRMADLLARAWDEWLLAEASLHPLLVVLEDLHWGDPATVRFVDAALRSLGDRPFAVLATARPEVHQTFPRLWADRRLHEVRLSELTRTSAEKLVRAVLGESVDAQTVARLVAQAGGNAFYLEELIRAVAEGRGDSLPQTVLAMAQARIEAFDAHARRVLRAASVFGETFWEGALVELLGHDTASTLSASLDALVGKEAISRRPQSRLRGEREFVFRHALVREAAYGMLTADDRARAHRAAAIWLEAHDEKNELTLAEHYLRGGDRGHAATWFRRATERALSGSDARAVIDTAQRAIDCGVDDEALGELRAMQAHAYNWIPSPEEALRSAREALRLLRSRGEWYARAACEAAQSFSVRGDFGGLAEIADVLENVRLDENPRRVAIPMGTALVQFGFSGQLALMARLEPLITRLEALLDANDATALAPVRLFTITRSTMMGHPEIALEVVLPTVRGFEQSGDERHAAVTLFGASQAAAGAGLWGLADEWGEQAFTRMMKCGLVAMSSGALMYRALAWAHRGEIARGMAVVREQTERMAAIGILPVEQATRVGLATVQQLAGDLDDALENALKVASAPVGWVPVLNNASAIAADVLFSKGRAAEALEWCDRAIARLDQGMMFAEGLLYLTRAKAFEALGRKSEADEAFAFAYRFTMERAARFRPEWGKQFLENLGWNREIVAMGRERGLA